MTAVVELVQPEPVAGAARSEDRPDGRADAVAPVVASEDSQVLRCAIRGYRDDSLDVGKARHEAVDQ